jgi:hypothetical protein
MVEFVHPHIAVGLIPLRHAKEVPLVETHHKDAEYKHAKQDANSYLWNSAGCPCDLFSKRHAFRVQGGVI